MELHIKNEITEISKEFHKGLSDDAPIAGSGYYVVDPLSAYLNFLGYKNTIQQIPQKKDRPLILIMVFEDGTTFIPAGSDIGHDGVIDWFWVDKD